MRNIFSLILCLFFALSLGAIERVSLDELNAGGWERLQGQQIEITTPLYLCGVYYDSLILASSRLCVPEEHAVGLDRGDSTEYYRLLSLNQSMRIRLSAKYDYYALRTGSVAKHLRARVMAPGRLVTGQTPRFHAPAPTRVPGHRSAHSLTICSANIQNFFYDLGGYASKTTTRGQYELQRLKIAHALTAMDADIYALCELEKGNSAPGALVEMMNSLTHSARYSYVNLGTSDGDTISVGYIYRADRVEPYGSPRFAYEQDMSSIYAYRFVLQGWRVSDPIAPGGEIFYTSLNHLRSKRGDAADANRKRMDNIQHVLNSLVQMLADSCYADRDVIMLGDYNCYTYEQPLQTLIQAGFRDMLPADGYSYVYNAEAGYLDRVFASPSMARMIHEVKPLHWCTDWSYSLGYKSKYNYKNRMIPVESPDNIYKVLSAQARKHLLYRYSDHDPILVTLRFVGE